ncbi:hypothetical protein BST91_12205 [Nonlabens tegetincola]|uniref:hypothetical protein n=1 Tax=Nonlabens tegetincola TaxID=323273 RepID=UPI000A205EBF|nr:hypothetical protein [Nonlabens tegetincola]ARN72369.1 hypothetical protein BST91_12205 [Nonlabens tegetincola]
MFFLNFSFGKNCDCGNFETGLIKYSVEDETGCCSGSFIGENGMIGFYEQSESAWMLVDVEPISFSSITEQCCS